MKVSNTAVRLQDLMRQKNLRQVDFLSLLKPFCQKYNIKFGKSHLSLYLAGKVEPKQDKLAIIAEAFNVSEAWLMGYDVPMCSDHDLAKSEELIRVYFHSVIRCLNDQLISKTTQKNVKGHFAEFLLRYKLFIEAVSNRTPSQIEKEIQNLEAWASVARSFALSEDDYEIPSICSYGIPYPDDISEDG